MRVQVNARAIQRQTRSYLSHKQEVWSHSAILDIEHPPGPPEPALHFVDDEKQAVLVAYVAHPLQEGRWRWDVSTLAEHGFDDDGGRVRWRALLTE